MWYLYSLLFCYIIGALLVVKIVNQAECNGTPLTDFQIGFVGVAIVLFMSIPFLNIILGVDAIVSFMFKAHKLEDEIDELIDTLRKSFP